MIEINLLPEEMKVPAKGSAGQEAVPVFEKIKKFLPLGAGLLGMLICFQAVFAVFNMIQAGRLSMLKNKWAAQEPQRKILEKSTKDYAILAEEAGFVSQLLKERLEWGQKLYSISAKIPAGIWINEITFSSNNFNLQGSVLSPQGGEVALINEFLSGLKADKDFYADFTALELGSVQRRMAGPYKVEDFTLAGKLK